MAAIKGPTRIEVFPGNKGFKESLKFQWRRGFFFTPLPPHSRLCLGVLKEYQGVIVLKWRNGGHWSSFGHPDWPFEASYNGVVDQDGFHGYTNDAANNDSSTCLRCEPFVRELRCGGR